MIRSIRWSLAVLSVTLCALGTGCADSSREVSATDPHEEHPMSTSVTPFLMFQKKDAAEAMDFYVSLFEDGRIITLERFPEDEPAGSGIPGTVKLGIIEIAGQRVRCFDSPPVHAFDFTPSFSLMVECRDIDEIESLASRLAEGGQTLLPLGEYPFARRFAWIQDRFGVSWQLMVS